MTSGCTKQAFSYRDYFKNTDGRAFEVVDISGDIPQNPKYFQQAENIQLPLLSNPDGRIANAFVANMSEPYFQHYLMELHRSAVAVRSVQVFSGGMETISV